MKGLLLTIIFFLLSAFQLLCGQDRSVLFIGNSLTYTNDLPDIVEKLAKSFDIKLRSESRCFPNYALEDHWRDGKVQQLIATGDFDLVIFQQGPSSQPPGREMLLNYGGKLSDWCRQHHAQPAFFMVWPSLYYYQTFDGLMANYREAATRSKALLLPVGSVWKAYRERNVEARLYGPDGFHPAPKGSFLAALTIFHELFPDRSLEELSYHEYRKWIGDRASFKELITFVNAYRD